MSIEIIPKDCSPEEVERAYLAEKTYCHLNGATVHFETEHGTEVARLVDVLRALRMYDPKDDDPETAHEGNWETQRHG